MTDIHDLWIAILSDSYNIFSGHKLNGYGELVVPTLLYGRVAIKSRSYYVKN